MGLYYMVPYYVDILIPTKDRAMQLHLLLESMGRYLKNIGRITISWQGSSEEYIKGYALLRQRVYKDETFTSLRKNSKEIVFRQRSSLHEVYEAAMDSGDSDYILPLIDDDVFIQDYDLVNHPASRYFYENDKILSCSVRLGDNLNDQVSSTTGDGVEYNKPSGHAVSLLSTGKPRFIVPRYYHLLTSNNGNTAEYLMWAWPENMNVPHWSSVLSTTGQIYRKKMYNELYNKFGKDNFLNIEGEGLRYLIKQFLMVSSVTFGFLRILDKLLLIIQEKKGIYGQELLLILLAKYLYRKRMYQNEDMPVPYLMVCPRHSVICNIDNNTSHNRGKNITIMEDYNCSYLDGYVISYEKIPIDKIVFPLHVYVIEEYGMRKYS